MRGRLLVAAAVVAAAGLAATAALGVVYFAVFATAVLRVRADGCPRSPFREHDRCDAPACWFAVRWQGVRRERRDENRNAEPV